MLFEALRSNLSAACARRFEGATRSLRVIEERGGSVTAIAAIFGVLLVAPRVIDRVSAVALITLVRAAATFGAEKAVERGLVVVTLCWDRGSNTTLLVIVVVHIATAEAGQGVELYSFLGRDGEHGGLVLSVDLAKDIVLCAFQEAIHVGMRIEFIVLARLLVVA